MFTEFAFFHFSLPRLFLSVIRHHYRSPGRVLKPQALVAPSLTFIGSNVGQPTAWPWRQILSMLWVFRPVSITQNV